MSTVQTCLARSVWLGLAGCLVGAAAPAHAYTAQIQFTASDFLVRSGAQYFLEEVAPQAEVSGSFTVSTDQPHELPDEPFTVEPSSDGPGYSGVNTWTPAVAADLTIAGVSYPAEEIQVHLGFVEGELALILVSARAGRASEELPAHVTTAGTNDFWLTVDFPGPAGGGQSGFGYTVAETADFGFVSQRGHVTVASDAGPIQEFEWVPPLVIPGFPCYVARPVPGEGSELADGALPGEVICDYDPFDPADDGEGLRDARLGDAARARAASGETATVTTALGTVTLRAKAPDRVLLTAAAGKSADVEPPTGAGSYRCAKVRRAPGTPPFERRRDVRLERGLASYDVGKPTQLCVASDGKGERLLCYAAKARGPAKRSSELWVAHELGVEKLRVGRAAELCLPVSGGE